ncbi:MAG: BLUF domain-containing protein [Sphingomonas fennica]
MAEQDYRIVYMSRARLWFSDAALGDLARPAQEANHRHGVTGLLLYDGLRFVQAIEGRQAPIRQLMTNIERDVRHDNVEIASEGEIDRREFGNWSLAFKRVSAGRCSRAFISEVSSNVAHVADPGMRALFIGFAALATEDRDA